MISFEEREDVRISTFNDDYGSSEDSFDVTEQENEVSDEVKVYGNTDCAFDEDSHEIEHVSDKSENKVKRKKIVKGSYPVKGCTSKPPK